MSRNYLTCPRCGFAMRIWGRRLDAVTAAARIADHLRFVHPTGVAAVSAALQQEEKNMPHSVVTHVKHSEAVAHDDANGVAALTAKYIADLEAAGHTIHHHHLHHHDVQHHGTHHHIPAHR